MQFGGMFKLNPSKYFSTHYVLHTCNMFSHVFKDLYNTSSSSVTEFQYTIPHAHLFIIIAISHSLLLMIMR